MYVTKVVNEKELILNSPHLKRKTAQLNLLQRQKASLKPSDGVNLLSINATPQYKESPPPPPQLSENNQLINVKTKKEGKSSDSDEFDYEGDDEEDTSKDIEMRDDSSPETIFTRIIKNLEMMSEAKRKKASVILKTLMNTQNISLQGSDGSTICIDGQETELKIVPFLYNLQQPTKILQPVEEYQAVLSLLQISADQVGNTYAKDIINNIRVGQSTRRRQLTDDEPEEEEDGEGYSRTDDYAERENQEEEEEEAYFTLPRAKKGQWWSFG